MVVNRKSMPASDDSKKRRRPAATPEARESQMIVLAEKLAERQLRDGSASAQVISHFLKLGSSREQIEQRRLEGEIELQKAKIEAMEVGKRMEELFTKAMDAFRGYQGKPTEESEEEYDDD